jgi:dTDP-4-amino-4,6-dideoxygalactose transaminase
MINVFQPCLGEADAQAVQSVMESNWIGKGSLVQYFEESFAEAMKVKPEHMIALPCATDGLFLACQMLDLTPGQQVILPTISFVGAANAVIAAGGTPILCDVDPVSLMPTLEMIQVRVTPLTRAVLITHYGGYAADMTDIGALCALTGMRIIEDAACSLGAKYAGQPVGTLGDFGIWSFDAMKILSTGDGGMMYCRSAADAERARRLAYFGMTEGTGLGNSKSDKWWEFDVLEVGRRSVMNNMTAAIGLNQLTRLPDLVEYRRHMAARYNRDLAPVMWLRRPVHPVAIGLREYGCGFYWVQVEQEILESDPYTRDKLAQFLRGCGVYTTFRYYPLHRIPLYHREGRLIPHDVTFPGADEAAQSTLLLPLHNGLSSHDVDVVVDSILSFGKRSWYSK